MDVLLGLIPILFLAFLVVVLMWVMLPFLIIGSNRRLDEAVTELRSARMELENIRRLLYEQNTTLPELKISP